MRKAKTVADQPYRPRSHQPCRLRPVWSGGDRKFQSARNNLIGTVAHSIRTRRRFPTINDSQPGQPSIYRSISCTHSLGAGPPSANRTRDFLVSYCPEKKGDSLAVIAVFNKSLLS